MPKKQRKAVVLTADKFEDMEVFFPVFRLLEEGWQVDIAAPKVEELHGENGYGLTPQLSFDEVKPDDYDLLIIPGGSPNGAPKTVRHNEKAREITRAFFAKTKPVGSLCHGPWTLADAGVIHGRHLTSYWHDGVPESVKEAGGIWEDKEAVVDGNLVTARYPMDLPYFMRELLKMVKKAEAKDKK